MCILIRKKYFNILTWYLYVTGTYLHNKELDNDYLIYLYIL